MILIAYQIFSNLLTPAVVIFFLLRLLKSKETLISLKQKFGFYTFQKSKKEIVWVNAVSIGESLSVISVIKEINKDKKFKILLTTSTTTSAEIIKKRYPDLLIHQFAPIDIPFIVKKFLNYWNPKIAIFSESELWPNLLSFTKEKKIKLILLNGRMSARTFKNWSRFPNISRTLLEKFNIGFVQDHNSYLRYQNLGLKNIKCIGNLKFLSEKLPVSKLDFYELKKNIENKLVICLCSSHKKEEEIVLESFTKLLKQVPNLFLIIIPRHIHRRDEIKKIIEKNKINFSMRSENKSFKSCECMLADTFGEVGLFLRISDIVIMGGSFVKKGGQNPIEVSFFKCPTIIGPYHENFSDVINLLEKKNAIIVIKDTSILTKVILSLIFNKDKRDEIGLNLFNVCKEERNKNIKILRLLKKEIG